MKNFVMIVLAGIFLLSSSASASSIRTPEGNFPRVQWAEVEATKGNLEKIAEIGARVLAKTSAAESGTYALYGVIEKNNPDLMRLLEIYESNEAYRIHSTSEAFQQYRAERLPILKGLNILPVNAIVLEQKDGETGKIVLTHTYKVNPIDLAKFQNILANEYIRAVSEDSGVVGMFLTAEQANPNFIHAMEIFKDDFAYQNYISSRNFQTVQRQLKSMMQNEKTVEYLPTEIVMTKKGARKK